MVGTSDGGRQLPVGGAVRGPGGSGGGAHTRNVGRSPTSEREGRQPPPDSAASPPRSAEGRSGSHEGRAVVGWSCARPSDGTASASKAK